MTGTYIVIGHTSSLKIKVKEHTILIPVHIEKCFYAILSKLYSIIVTSVKTADKYPYIKIMLVGSILYHLLDLLIVAVVIKYSCLVLEISVFIIIIIPAVQAGFRIKIIV